MERGVLAIAETFVPRFSSFRSGKPTATYWRPREQTDDDPFKLRVRSDVAVSPSASTRRPWW